ncbi:MAG: YqcC family protein [Gammaproteobacteria bacterium]|nr:MAG: YqcC family protein [Gammaproteobacteria bacterium]
MPQKSDSIRQTRPEPRIRSAAVKKTRNKLAGSLDSIQSELQKAELWENTSPPPHHLQSTEPFCVDTLDFSQWLQWVFIPKMRFILDQEAPLPPASSIHILAQEALKDMDQDMSRLIAAIRRFDRLLSGDDA